MKNLLKNLLILGIILLGNTQLIPITKAQTQTEVCQFMNYQYASVEDKKKGTVSAIFNDKLAVVTEEKLGIADGVNSFDCVRRTYCEPQADKTTATDKAQDSAGDAVDAAASGNANAAADAAKTATTTTTPSVRRVCSTTYAETCEGGNTAEEIAAARKDSTTGKYTICEPVRIYISTTGSNLLYYYIGQIYRYVAGVGGLLAVLILIIAGIMRTTAGDNTNQITQANNLVTKSITGLIVLFLSAIILYTINPNFFVL